MVFFQSKTVSQNFSTFFSESKCGMNFTQASVLLGKRMAPYGYPYYGMDQPTSLVISGIPSSAKIEKAFIWWDIAGIDTSESVILQNPDLLTDTFIGTVMGGNTSMCWGPGFSFRADVTGIISGNGTYLLSGLPTDTTFDFLNYSDVTGATLFIIYSDPSANYIGNIIINGGMLKIYNDTVFETITFSSPGDTVYGKAFMLLSDMQGQSGNSIKMNNGPFIVPSQDYWDFEQRNTVFVPNYNYSIFGVRVPNDCVHAICLGIFFQSSVSPLYPIISRFGDILTSSPGSSYQWYFNSLPIPNATSQTYLASQTGVYFVEVFDNFGCSFFSDSFDVVTCEQKIKPNINFSAPDSLWTDSMQYNLQWFYNGIALANANSNFIIATASGSYWVQAQDSEGCSVSSDIVTVTIIGTNENNSAAEGLKVFPNPGEGFFRVRIPGNNSGFIPGDLQVFNIFGEKVFSLPFTGPSLLDLDLSFLAKGVYLLKASGQAQESEVILVIR